ncbi:MAG: hypothetical protein KDK10_10210 [Maritimibacter sp.]|nr:hypothetical protein [Maritimibacter sp.]
MGTLLIVVLLLAVPLWLQLRGWNVSAQLFAVAVVVGLIPLLEPVWLEMGWVRTLNTTLLEKTVGYDPCLFATDRNFCRVRVAPDTFWVDLEFFFILATIAAVGWVQERLNPDFLRQTKRLIFWAATVFAAYSRLNLWVLDLGSTLAWTSPKPDNYVLTPLGAELINKGAGAGRRMDDLAIATLVIVFVALVVILILSIAGIILHFLRRSAPRS